MNENQTTVLKMPSIIDSHSETPARAANYGRPVASTPLRTPLNKNVDKKDENNASFESMKSPISTTAAADTPKIIVKKTINRPPLSKLTANPAAQHKPIVSRIAQKSTPNTDETEQQTIEKILAKRFNPRRREHEYLIKWENFTHEQNTWEPQSHLSTCAQLLETFEKQLARQKEQRAALAAKAAAAEAEAAQKAQQQQQPVAATHDADGLPVSPVRPGRSSKAKAMDQVKQWCADNEEEAQKKRKASDGEYDPNATDEDITLVGPPAKAVRRESPAVVQAIQRAGQTGVRIVPVNKPAAPVGIAPKVNGLNMKSPEKVEAVAQNVNITKQTGIIKKPGGVQIAIVKAGEAQIRVVQKGDATSSGVVRINAVSSAQQSLPPLASASTGSPAPVQFTRVVQRTATGTTVKTIPSTGSTIIRQTVAPRQPPTHNTKASIAARAPPPNVQTTIRNHPLPPTTNIKPATPQSRVQQQAQRTSISPQHTSKATITRITKPTPKPVTSQEDKLAALQRHGDLKITRKQLPQQQQTTTAKPQQKPIKQQTDDSGEYSHQDPFGVSHSDISLCPITGKVLGNQNHEQIDIKVNTLKMEQQQEHLQQQQLQQEGAGLMTVDDGSGAGEIQQMMVNEDGSPILVTGEDGTVYQVAGKNEQGQTILIAQGSDGEQQCVYVTSEETEDPAGILGGDMQDASAALLSLDQHHHTEQQVQQQHQEFVIKGEDGSQQSVDATQPLAIATDSDSQDGQITAEVVQADLPSPGNYLYFFKQTLIFSILNYFFFFVCNHPRRHPTRRPPAARRKFHDDRSVRRTIPSAKSGFLKTKRRIFLVSSKLSHSIMQFAMRQFARSSFIYRYILI